MAFIFENLRHYITSKMEDPVERQQRWREHTRRMARIAAAKRQQWTHPTKSYKYWTTDMANAKYNFNKEPGHMALPGRGSPSGGEHNLRE